MNSKLDIFEKIVEENNVHIGNSSLIMPGVKIGNDCIIGAGSVITKSIPDGKIIAGNPGKIVGETISFLERAMLQDMGTKGMSYDEKKRCLLSRNDDEFIQK